MSAAAVASDPAVVSAKPTRQRKEHSNNKGGDHNNAQNENYLPKVEKPKSSANRVRHVKVEEEGTPAKDTFPDVDFTTHIVVHTTPDNEYVSIPRAAASNIPTLTVPAAPTGDDAKSTPVVVTVTNLHSGALIAINEWIEKKGPSGASTVAFTNPITHTEIAQMLTDDWEKSFSQHFLKDHGEVLIGCINFAEKNQLKGLQQFALVALSCALRGKTEHEMAVAMGFNDDKFTDEEITKGRAAFPEVFNVTKNRN